MGGLQDEGGGWEGNNRDDENITLVPLHPTYSPELRTHVSCAFRRHETVIVTLVSKLFFFKIVSWCTEQSGDVVGFRVSQVSLTSAGDSGHVSRRSILSAKSGDSKVSHSACVTVVVVWCVKCIVRAQQGKIAL